MMVENASCIPVVLTIGSFDGVHRGHRYLLRQVVERAQFLGLASLCVTLYPLPEVVLYPERRVLALSGPQEKVQLLKEVGFTQVLLLEFTRELSMLRPEEFLEMVQVRAGARLQELWIGYDFAMGRDRQGSFAVLAELGRVDGFALHVVPPLRDGVEIISSSYIRSLLAEGDVARAAALLGRPYRLQGEVVHGSHRGNTIGFPTANLAIAADRAIPGDGVYVARARFRGQEGEPQALKGAVVNVGGRPTFGDSQRFIEAHILDFDGDLYGQPLELEFLERVRDTKRFQSQEALSQQIQRDLETARRWLADRV